VKRKVMIALNAAWNLVNFRAGLIRALVDAGFDVVAVAPRDEYADGLAALGCRYAELPMDNMGTHPGRDLLLLWRFHRLLRRERPDVLLAYTIKPNVYGSLAAHALGIPVVNNIAGLGTAFHQETWLTRVVRRLYRLALQRSHRVFFQNDEDRDAFVGRALVRPQQAARLPGSGVDLGRFSPVPPPRQPAAFRFLLIGRLLWDKGVGEYVEAARILRQRFPDAEFALLGFLNTLNRTAISREQVEAWQREGLVCYLGESDDVRQHIADAHCVVLPSYREGVPRALLEAAAMARPVITTDAPGCRDAVDAGCSGLLCEVRDATSLADSMATMLSLSEPERLAMGQRGREKMEREFDERVVIDRYLSTLREITRAAAG
jgi:glycosyltransferase involved in cell wall biosynthesis